MRLNFKLKTCKSSMVKLFFFRYADMRRRRGQVLCCSFFMFACLAEVLKVVDFRIYFNCLKFSCDRSIEKCNILVIKIWLRINVFSSRVSLVQFTQMHFLRCRWFRGFLEYYLCILSAKLGVGGGGGTKYTPQRERRP